MFGFRVSISKLPFNIAGLVFVCTCDRGEEDAHQQCEGGGDVSEHIRLLSGCRMCNMRGVKGAFLHHVTFAEVGAPQVLYEEEIQHTLISEIMYLLVG